MNSRAAFSLTELLAVMVIGTIVLGLAAQSSLPDTNHRALEMGSRELHSLLREARMRALQHRSPTRVVFIPESLSRPDQAPSEGEPYVECALFQFVIPPAAERSVTWQSPANGHSLRGGDALERLPVTAPGLPWELVGRWQRVARKPVRFDKMLNRSLRLHSELLDRFAQQGPELFARENGFRPFTFWVEGESHPGSGTCPSSPYPEDYFRTPWPDSPRLVRRPLPASARVYDPQSQQWQPAGTYWPRDVPILHFSRDEISQLAYHDVPWIEFDSTGRMQVYWEGNTAITLEIERHAELQTTVHFGGPDALARWVKNAP